MSHSNCAFLTCIQVSQKASQVVWYSHLFQNFPHFIVIHTVKGGALQQKLIVFKIKINTLIFQKCIFLDFLESPRLGCQPQSGQEATLRNRHGAKDWSKMGKGVCKGCILSPCLLTYMQSTSCKMPGWIKHKLESRLLEEISITSDMNMTPPHGRKWGRTKEPLDEGERGGWKRCH